MFKAIVSEHLSRTHSTKKYVIVDKKTGDVLDNNHGVGYDSEQKALTKYSIKNGIQTPKQVQKYIDKRRRHAHEYNEEIRSINLEEE